MFKRLLPSRLLVSWFPLHSFLVQCQVQTFIWLHTCRPYILSSHDIHCPSLMPSALPSSRPNFPFPFPVWTSLWIGAFCIASILSEADMAALWRTTNERNADEWNAVSLAGSGRAGRCRREAPRDLRRLSEVSSVQMFSVMCKNSAHLHDKTCLVLWICVVFGLDI